MAPWPRCQFTYEPEAQCVWSGCAEGQDYCGIHQEVVNARQRSRDRQARVRVERSNQEKSAPSVTGSSIAQR